MTLFIVLIIILTTGIFQSIFGVGILLIGTPLLMLVGMPYTEVISYTVPCSFAISIIQVFSNKKSINNEIFKNAILYSLPAILLGLLFIPKISKYLALLMGVFLFISTFDRVLAFILPYNSSKRRVNVGLFLTGFIHGLTSMGGGLLPRLVSQSCKEKNNKIATTASVYIVFQMTQIIFLFYNNINFNFKILFPSIVTSIIAYFFIGKLIFNTISTINYIKFLKYFIRIVSIFLIIFKIKTIYFG